MTNNYYKLIEPKFRKTTYLFSCQELEEKIDSILITVPYILYESTAREWLA